MLQVQKTGDGIGTETGKEKAKEGMLLKGILCDVHPFRPHARAAGLHCIAGGTAGNGSAHRRHRDLRPVLPGRWFCHGQMEEAEKIPVGYVGGTLICHRVGGDRRCDRGRKSSINSISSHGSLYLHILRNAGRNDQLREEKSFVLRLLFPFLYGIMSVSESEQEDPVQGEQRTPITGCACEVMCDSDDNHEIAVQ